MNMNGALKRLSMCFVALIILVHISVVPISVSAAYYKDTFDLDKAQKYAKTWYNGFNTDEYVTKDSDCANFVSQILIAGGIPETPYFHASKKYSSSKQQPSTYNVPSLIQYFRSMYGVAYYNKARDYNGNYTLSVGSVSAETYIAGSYNYNGVTRNACDGHNFGINNIEPGDCITINGDYGRDHIVYVLEVDYDASVVYITGHNRPAYGTKDGICTSNGKYDISLIKGVLKTSDLVGKTPTSPEINIAGPSASGSINYGDNFNVSGIVSSGLPLTSVKLNFIDGVGNTVCDYEMEPNGSTNFSIATSISYLPVGVHKFTVTASNAEKTNETLYEKTFAVLSHDKTLDNGTYKISYSDNSTYLVGAADVNSGDNVNLYVDSTQSGNPQNIWYIQNEGNGYYLIRNFKSGCYLDVANGSSKDGTNVSQWELNRGDGQLWQILPAGGGTYCLVPKCAVESGADVNGGNNSNIEIYGLHLGVNQRFSFTHTDGFTNGNKITFNLNGGTIPTSFAHHTVNGVNRDIDMGELIIYNTPGQTVRLHDASYVMAKVTSNGNVGYCSKYVSGDEDVIPSDGFIIVGHRSRGNDGASFLEQIQFGNYIGYDSSTKTAYAYKTESAYLANHKYVESGSAYGTLPTPIRTGYDFNGWYTSASGGTKITSGSTYSTNTLYAHWKTASGVVSINSTTFPDENFRAYISEAVDDDKNGWLSEDEIRGQMTMTITNRGIKDLTGIEYFTSLQWLYCQQNSLTSIDLSQNKVLSILNCSNNKLVSLDFSNNQMLWRISCSNNNLVSVNLNNTKVTETSFTCNTDKEHSFNIGTVKNSYSLSNLEKYGFVASKASNWSGAVYNSSTNSLTNFTSTEISYDYDCGNGITATFYLTAYLDENIVQINSSTFPDANFRSYVLETIDSDKDGWLSKSESTRNSMSLSNKGIKDLTGIEYFTVQWLYCQNNELTSIDISQNQTLAIFNCSNNKLVSLDCSNNPSLATVNLSNNNLVSLNVSNTRIGEYSIRTTEQGNGFNIGTVNGSYSLSNLTKYGFVSSKASNWKGAVYNSSSNSLTDFTSTQVSYDYDCGNGLTATFYLVADIPNSKKIDINSTNFPDSVFRSYVLNNIDMDRDAKLSQSEIDSTTSIILDRGRNNGAKNLVGIEYFTELIELDCRFNAITSLDVSKNTKLQRLFCGSNKLTSLDVGKNTDLTYLDCMENNLTVLNVSQNRKLATLDCNDNRISSIDLSNNLELEVLYCYLNELTMLDLSKNVNLKSLKAHSNYLTSLDLSNTQITKTNLSANRFEIGRESSYDLSNLSRYGFNMSKASNWQGAVYKSGMLDFITGSDVMYDYDCGNGVTATFELYRNPISLKDSLTNIGVSNISGFGYDMSFSASPNQFSVNLGEGLTAVKVYDTMLIKSDSENDFEGNVSISIPAPNGYDTSKLKVLHKENDGTFKDMKAVYNSVSKTLEFESNTFGTYVVALSEKEIKGDLNNDGNVDLKDLAVMKRILASDNPEQYANIADLNSDGKVDLKDLSAMKYYLAEN